MKKWLTILVLFSVVALASDQPTRGFNKEELSSLNKLKAYDYDRTIPPSENYLNRVLNAIANFIDWLFSTGIGQLILAFIAIMIAWLIVRNMVLGKFKVSESKTPEDLMRQMTREQLDALDLDTLMQQAKEAGDFRLAIRFGFLKILKALQALNQIEWHPEKTNRQYLNELDGTLRKPFHRAVFVYEYVWYGEFEPTPAHFTEIEQVLMDVAPKPIKP
jgi:hypothetical protein